MNDHEKGVLKSFIKKEAAVQARHGNSPQTFLRSELKREEIETLLAGKFDQSSSRTNAEATLKTLINSLISQGQMLSLHVLKYIQGQNKEEISLRDFKVAINDLKSADI